MKQLQHKKAEMGIGTLIIFIALLLVAAIAAGVLIQTAGALQEKALSTGDQAKGQIATNARVVEVSATDGQTGNLTDFTQILKLAPGSNPIKLTQTLLTFNTYDRTATLHYAGDDATYEREAQGYYTRQEETIGGADGTYNATIAVYDDDSVADTLYGGTGGSRFYFNLSNEGEVLLGNCTGTTWNPEMGINDYLSSSDAVCEGGNVTSVTINPKNRGYGVFSVQYLQTGSNHVEGNLQRGDVIKLYYRAPRAVTEDEAIRLNFIPKIGTPTKTEFITPEVISTERIYLYP